MHRQVSAPSLDGPRRARAPALSWLRARGRGLRLASAGARRRGPHPSRRAEASGRESTRAPRTRTQNLTTTHTLYVHNSWRTTRRASFIASSNRAPGHLNEPRASPPGRRRGRPALVTEHLKNVRQVDGRTGRTPPLSFARSSTLDWPALDGRHAVPPRDAPTPPIAPACASGTPPPHFAGAQLVRPRGE